MSKAKSEDALKQYHDEIERVNAAFEKKAAELVVQWAKHPCMRTRSLLDDCTVEVARKAARRFRTLRFSLEIDGDYSPRLVAYPLWKPLELPTHAAVAKGAAEKATELLAGIDAYFPPIEIVQAYAEGLKEAAKAEREMQDLRGKYEEMRRELRDSATTRGYRMYHPFWGPMGWR